MNPHLNHEQLDLALSFTELAHEIYNVADKQGLALKNPDELPKALSYIHSEISEVLTAYCAGQYLGTELADIIIWTLSLAADLNIDIGYEILVKHEKNKRRPFKHGRVKY